ncbi:MAG: hypothetical protein EOP84_24520 [Verrucomicrobiaceae bacterium]|nr:MAG: hypothetical protein EOP84_24520 [Verrucomicrobiaceae bacterium]
MFEQQGFLSPDTDRLAAVQRRQQAGWAELARDINEAVQQLLMETRFPYPVVLRDPKVLARLLLGRALSNFQGAVLLWERGMTVEARTLARACLESTFCMTAALQAGEGFIDRLLLDAHKHKRTLARNLITIRSEADLGPAMFARLKAFTDTLPEEGTPRWLPAKEMADASPIGDMYVFYRELSGDSAHPTIEALERYLKPKEEGELSFKWGWEQDPAEILSTIYYACIFITAAGVAFNGQVARNAAVDRVLAGTWTRLGTLQELTAAGENNLD